jgi:hypothetical protein
MAVDRVPYKDINQVLQAMRTQIIDSLDYCVEELPSFDHPEQLFDFCRNITTYHLDPKGVELIQSVPTLLENNYWGISGAGDCDCFTILTIALCIAQGWNDNFIVLVGRKKVAPVHVYSAVKFNGQLYTLDLTNPYINIERPYKYRQFVAC